MELNKKNNQKNKSERFYKFNKKQVFNAQITVVPSGTLTTISFAVAILTPPNIVHYHLNFDLFHHNF